MNWQEKAAALNAIGRVNLLIRKPGDWYVHHEHVEIKDRCFLRGSFGNGATPEAAIEDHWRKFVDEIGSCYVVTNAYSGNRRAVRWNGFMWQDWPESA